MIAPKILTPIHLVRKGSVTGGEELSLDHHIYSSVWG